MASRFNLLPVPSHIESEQEMKDFVEIIARNWRILRTRLDSGDETFITNVSRRSVSGIAGVPTGAVFETVADTAPSGWLLCFGQAVSRTVYSALFALAGTKFGTGDGSTTFNLPDMRGRVPLGKDNMGGTSADRVTDAAADSLGGVGGAETHTLTVAEIPAHKHNLLDDSGNGTLDGVAIGVNNDGNPNSDVILDTGGGDPHANVQPYQVFNYIVKT